MSVCVADTGPGMPAEDLERIFEPFYTRKVLGRSGTGLEMTVVLGTVQDHQGYIASESSEGEGTTFTFYLPATRAEVQEREPQDIQDYLGRGEHVVVVDDVDVQRDIATQILMRLGYSVQSFASGEEAVEYLKDHSADLVILDMIMDPGIDGLETYRRILQYHPGQKAIIASGYSETQRVRELQILGAGSYIKKPYLIEKLGIAVRTELDR
ncbi:Histidine kinase (fragment) [anaerobic digester metagenome]|uniref:histidine kinase n=1 Tax=anaerobic digester metagenome TaxID=1263854 RepID=A0A485LZM5_9ZZZZ